MSSKRAAANVLGLLPEAVADIRLLPPPYWGLLPWPRRPGAGLPSASGVVLTVQGRLEAGQATPLATFLRSLRRTFPGAPISILMKGPGAPRSREESNAARLGNLPFVRVVFEGSYERQQYRNTVCSMKSQDFRDWMFAVARPGTVAHMGVVTWVLHAFEDSEGGLSVGESQLCRLLHELELPTPHRWKMAKQAVAAVLAMQREGSTISEAAFQGGYSEPSAFRRHCALLFGVPPVTLRIWAGWEPLLARFVDAGKR